ncbi:MAG: DUF4872 domain-containing protein [Bacteroidales bacterium]|nr:DUF4872 domain-containing protein [Bacteroidales bacterium]HPM18979.1 BtrH N-terminal domain-containing protein [Bacteroidales bacterium]
MKIEFEHRQAAHCENGVTAGLLRYYGIDLSEPMVFGTGSGIFFSHMVFIRVNEMAVTSFRVWPGVIFKRVTKRFGVSIKWRKFRDPDKAMQALDSLLARGIPVGMLVGVFNLPYFPKEYRFHFNAHNITVIGKEGDKYLISDPVTENVESLTYDELKKVRFAKGTVPPKGRMYYVTSMPEKFDLKSAIIKGIRKTANDMINIPLPMFGVKGIRYLAGKMREWPSKLGDRSAVMNLGQVIRMLEEIGTGGAGFRFIYAAFLQESARVLQLPVLDELSVEMTGAGDRWREFAWQASRCFKNRDNGEITYDMLADILLDIAAREERVFRQLGQLKFT